MADLIAGWKMTVIGISGVFLTLGLLMTILKITGIVVNRFLPLIRKIVSTGK